MKSSFLTVALILLTETILANGNRVGNGGDIIQCQGKSPQVLDFYETSRMIPESDEEPLQILKKVYQKLKERHPKLGEQYLKRADSILSEVEWSKAALKEIDDSEELFRIPKDCQLSQVAMRKIKKLPLSMNFMIDKSLWENLSSTQKAGLLSHEIIYEHFSKLGESNSRKAREFNAFLFSEDFKNSTPKQIRKVLEKFEISVD
ncbi:MAG: hypothetical protein ACAH59_06375 [Pseudobdellovibrionaceae bacterium]